jgi:hypothetical protein
MAFGGDGLVHGHWGVVDKLAVIQQFGVLPADHPA